MKKNLNIIKEDIAMLKGIKVQFIKKGKFKIADEIQEEIEILERMLKGGK